MIVRCIWNALLGFFRACNCTGQCPGSQEKNVYDDLPPFHDGLLFGMDC